MKDKKKTTSLYVLRRLLAYMVKSYKFSFLVVVLCIIIGAFATMQGMLFVQSLVDDYIVPLLNAENPDFTPLAHAIAGIVVFLHYRYCRCVCIQQDHGKRQPGYYAEVP